MSFQKFYKTSLAALFLLLFVLISSGLAQKPRPTPTLVIRRDNRQMPVATGNNLYCAGFIQTASVDTSYEIVGSQDERDKHVFAQNDELYISAGANRNVRVGDMFSVIRPRGRVDSRSTKRGNLGFYVQEVGMVEVIRVKPEVSVVRVKTSCDNLLLGDLLQPIPQRTSPSFVAARPALDLFGEPSGKASGKILMARGGLELLGREQIVYIDLGAEDNVQVGDYLTIYRPLGTGNLFIHEPKETISARTAPFESRRYRGGKFSNQAGRKAGATATGEVVTSQQAKDRRPRGLREVVGEIVILNVKERTATAVITRTATEIHPGDNVEVQ
ncbi:MAG: hypothetical protein M3033_13065 [Acidobacteriota bacterium]|nr:hypothetical protein [Acidobacteriota bacterium]